MKLDYLKETITKELFEAVTDKKVEKEDISIQDDGIWYGSVSSKNGYKMSLSDFTAVCKEWLVKQEDYIMLESQQFKKNIVIQLSCNITKHDAGSRKATEIEAISDLIAQYIVNKSKL
jgi:nitrogen fixation protein